MKLTKNSTNYMEATTMDNVVPEVVDDKTVKEATEHLSILEKFNFEEFTERLIIAVIVTILFFLLYKSVNWLVKFLFKKSAKAEWTDTARVETYSKLTRSFLHYITIFLYIYTILGVMGFPVGSLLTGAGVLGVGLSFAGKDLVGDLINGFFIITENQVNVGDYVKFNNLSVEGYVKVVGIRSLVIQAKDGANIFIPNRNVLALINYSREKYSKRFELMTTQDRITQDKAKLDQILDRYTDAVYKGTVYIDSNLYLQVQATDDVATVDTVVNDIIDSYYQGRAVEPQPEVTHEETVTVSDPAPSSSSSDQEASNSMNPQSPIS
jgi:small conductance mechanosensitive channel